MTQSFHKIQAAIKHRTTLLICWILGFLMHSCSSDKEPDVWKTDTYKVMFSGDVADFYGGITISNIEVKAYLMCDKLEGHDLFSCRGFTEDWEFSYRYADREIPPKVDFACSALHFSDDEVKHIKATIIRLRDGVEVDRYEFETHSYPPGSELDSSAYLCRIKI